jgi:hypothetical protein
MLSAINHPFPRQPITASAPSSPATRNTPSLKTIVHMHETKDIPPCEIAESKGFSYCVALIGKTMTDQYWLCHLVVGTYDKLEKLPIGLQQRLPNTKEILLISASRSNTVDSFKDLIAQEPQLHINCHDQSLGTYSFDLTFNTEQLIVTVDNFGYKGIITFSENSLSPVIQEKFNPGTGWLNDGPME